MEYLSYTYLYPPRPRMPFPPERSSFFEKRDYWMQIKMNGTCSVIFVSPDKKITVKTRHGDAEHKAWRYNEAALSIFKTLPGTGWYVFVAELMHSKVPGLRDIFYVHEILVDNGNYLIGSTFEERQERLARLFLEGRTPPPMTLSHYVLDEHTWLARNHKSGFPAVWEQIRKAKKPEYEGAVYSDRFARLELCTRPESNVAWKKKSRIVDSENRNYAN